MLALEDSKLEWLRRPRDTSLRNLAHPCGAPPSTLAIVTSVPRAPWGNGTVSFQLFLLQLRSSLCDTGKIFIITEFNCSAQEVWRGVGPTTLQRAQSFLRGDSLILVTSRSCRLELVRHTVHPRDFLQTLAFSACPCTACQKLTAGSCPAPGSCCSCKPHVSKALAYVALERLALGTILEMPSTGLRAQASQPERPGSKSCPRHLPAQRTGCSVSPHEPPF